MSITLTLKEEPSVPLEAEVLSPSLFADLSHDEICGLKMYHGKRQVRIDDFFDVEGERSDLVEIQGDLHRVRLLGRGMDRGQLTVRGNVGMHLGAHMKGGRIDVHGNASDWIGAEMKNGFIHVRGNGGGQIGGGYRGSLRGMKNGTIIVDGTAGLEVGLRTGRSVAGTGTDGLGSSTGTGGPSPPDVCLGTSPSVLVLPSVWPSVCCRRGRGCRVRRRQ